MSTNLKQSILENPVHATFAFALAVTGAVYVDAWNGSLPEFSNPIVLGLLLLLGVIAERVLSFVRSTVASRPIRRVVPVAFGLLVVLVVLIQPIRVPPSWYLFPLVAVWSSVISKIVTKQSKNPR